MKSFDEIFALATSPLHREYAETFTDPRLSWGVGVTQGVAVAMQEAQAEIDALLEAMPAEREIERLKTKIVTLFDAIKHGDQDHQDWLFDAIQKHFGVSDEN